MSFPLSIGPGSFGAVQFWQEDSGILHRIWDYIRDRLPFFNDRLVVGKVVLGIAVLVFTLFLSRNISSLLDQRIAKRTHLDPGLRYTIARLVRYLLVVISVLVALKLFWD